MKNFFLISYLLAALLLAAQTKAKTITKTKATAAMPLQVSAATVTRVVQTLVTDDMQGRGTGQPGGLHAA